MPLNLGSSFREERRRDASSVAAYAALELLLALERLDMHLPVLDHPLDERPHLTERGIRLLWGEVAHACNPMCQWNSPLSDAAQRIPA
jgi:hypothetical protein